MALKLAIGQPTSVLTEGLTSRVPQASSGVAGKILFFLPVRFFRECFQTFLRFQERTFSLGLMLLAFNKGFGI